MPGLYFMPTVLADVEDGMWVAKEESFGPIMVVSKFQKGDTKEVRGRPEMMSSIGGRGGVSQKMTIDDRRELSLLSKLDDKYYNTSSGGGS